jgi:hypothetical protein
LQWIKMQVDHGLELPLAQALEHERDNRPAGSAETDARLQELGWSKPKT